MYLIQLTFYAFKSCGFLTGALISHPVEDKGLLLVLLMAAQIWHCDNAYRKGSHESNISQ